MQGLNAVTTAQTFGPNEEPLLFCVNAGIPVEIALERAALLMACVEAMVTVRRHSDTPLPTKAIQCVAQTARAIVQACRSDVPSNTGSTH